jgi:ferritin-like metal-binding protein YciE
MDDITTLMVEQLKDLHSAERQLLRALPRMQKAATSPTLQECFQLHAEQTEAQVERIVQALEQVGGKPGRKVCEAMRGLIEEATHEMQENDRGPMMDVLLIAAAQRVEHYEIAAYGTLVTLAKAAGQSELAGLLAQTLNEEKETDAKLTQVAESEVNPAFIEAARSRQDEADMASANENRRGGGRRRAS